MDGSGCGERDFHGVKGIFWGIGVFVDNGWHWHLHITTVTVVTVDLIDQINQPSRHMTVLTKLLLNCFRNVECAGYVV